MIRLLLADDQPLLRLGYRMVLDAEPDMTVVAEAGTGREAVEQVSQHAPDVVLMDVRMPEMDGIAATADITRTAPQTRVIILTTFQLDEYVFAGLRSGAAGFLLKDVEPPALVAAIRAVWVWVTWRPPSFSDCCSRQPFWRATAAGGARRSPSGRRTSSPGRSARR